MNKWIEKIQSHKKIAIGVGAAIIVLAGILLYFLLSGGDSKSKTGTKNHSSGELITTEQQKATEKDSETTSKDKESSETTTNETTSGETTNGETTSEQRKPSNGETTGSQTSGKQNIPAPEIGTTTNQEYVTEPQKNTEPETQKVEYQYKIPAIYIDTENKVPITSNSLTVEATLTLDGRNTGYVNMGANAIKIRGRGHSTWKLDKKPYQIKFEEKTSVMGMTEAKRYILLANYSDKSLLRNHTAFAMAKTLNNLPFVPHAEPVDVYLNGTYMGVYSICEKIEMKKGRVEVEMGDETSANTGYLLEVGGFDDEDDGYAFNTDCLKDVVVKTPEYELINAEQKKYIEQYVKDAEKAVKKLSNYEEYIDIPSLIDWFILHELTYNLDSCFNKSCYMVKAANGKLQMGPPWGFDTAFGNFIYDNPNYDGWASVGSSDGSSYIKETWMNYLLSDSKFNTKLKQRWAEKKDTLVNTALAEIETTKNKIYKSQMDNFKLWDIWNMKIGNASDAATAQKTFDAQTEYLKNFIKNRKQWMDNAINNLP